MDEIEVLAGDYSSPGVSSTLPPLIRLCATEKDETAAYPSIKALLEAGAHPETRAINGATALHFASKRGWQNVCQLLLGFGAKADTPMTGGYTASYFALGTPHFKLLGDTDAKSIMEAARGDNGRLRSILQARDAVECRDSRHRTPLMEAALYGNLDGTRLLLDAGADANATDFAGHSALMIACWQDNIHIWLEFQSRGYALNPADNAALAWKQDALQRYPSASLLLNLPLGCCSPSLIAHQVPYEASELAFKQRLMADIVVNMPTTAIDMMHEMLLTSGPSDFVNFITEVHCQEDIPDYDTAMWDAACFTTEWVASHGTAMDPSLVFALFLYTYPWTLGQQLHTALCARDETTLTKLKPMWDAVVKAIQELPSLPEQTVYKPMECLPHNMDCQMGSSMTILAPISACRTQEQATQWMPTGSVLKIRTNHAKDISPFRLLPLDDECIILSPMVITVTHISINGKAVAFLPSLSDISLDDAVIIEAVQSDYPGSPEVVPSPLSPLQEASVLGFTNTHTMPGIDSPPQFPSPSFAESADVKLRRRSSPSKPPLHPDALPLTRRMSQRGPHLGAVRSPYKGMASPDSFPDHQMRRLSLSARPYRPGSPGDLVPSALRNTTPPRRKTGSIASAAPCAETTCTPQLKSQKRRGSCGQSSASSGNPNVRGSKLIAPPLRRNSTLTFLVNGPRRKSASSDTLPRRTSCSSDNTEQKADVSRQSTFELLEAQSPSNAVSTADGVNNLSNLNLGGCGGNDGEDRLILELTLDQSRSAHHLVDDVLRSPPRGAISPTSAHGITPLGGRFNPRGTTADTESITSPTSHLNNRLSLSPPPISFDVEIPWRSGIGSSVKAGLMAFSHRPLLPLVRAPQHVPSGDPQSPSCYSPDIQSPSRAWSPKSPGARLFQRLFKRSPTIASSKDLHPNVGRSLS